ncbi:MAG: hypothetical protein AAGH65_03420 [Pseudomonadota bacterium]
MKSWNAVYVVDVNNPENRFSLEPHGNGLIRSQVFAGRLPPGHYQIEGLWAQQTIGDVTYSLLAPGSENLGSFIVEENRISSLGTLVFQPLDRLSGARLKTESPYMISRFDDTEKLTTFVAEAYPEIYHSLQPTTILGWEPDVYGQFRSGANEVINNITVGLEHQWLGDQQITMTGPLGKIMFRDAVSGEWQHADTGFNLQLAAITRYRNGYISAGERGIVLQSKTLGGDWQRVPGPSTQEAIFWMHFEPDHGLFALTRAGSTVQLYSVNDDFDWTPIFTTEHESSFWSGGQYTVFATAPGDGSIVLFANEERIVYSITDNTFDRENHQRLIFVTEQPDKTLLHHKPKLLNFREDQVSFNAGQDWDEIRRVRDYEQWNYQSASDPIVLNQEDVLAISHRGYREGTQIEYQEEPKVRRAKHRARKINGWGEALPWACTTLLPEISTPERIFAQCYGGSLLRSEDQGRTWQLDFQPGVIDNGTEPDNPDSTV